MRQFEIVEAGMRMRILLFACALSFLGGCKSEVAQVNIVLQADGSGVVDYQALVQAESRPMSPGNTPFAIGGAADGMTGTVGIQFMAARFGDIRSLTLGGITFDRLDEAGQWVLRVSIPAGSAAPWRSLIPDRKVIARLRAIEAAIPQSRSAVAGPEDDSRPSDHERHTTIDIHIEMPGPIVVQSLPDSVKTLGWRYDAEPGERSAYLRVPIATTGNEPERAVWELRSSRD